MWEKTLERNGHIVIIGVLAVMAFFGAGLAANIDTGSGGSAGQGVNVTEGYTAGVVSFSGGWAGGGNNTNTNVTSFSFVLKKNADGSGPSTVTNENTVIYSQLTGASSSNWVRCSVAPAAQQGTVGCALSGAQQKLLAEVTGVNVVAYDNNDSVVAPSFAPVSDGLVLYLDAASDESWPGSGTTWFDLSGNGNDATLHNGLAHSTVAGGSFLFDNVDDYASLPDSLGYTTTVSAFGWVRTSGTPKGSYHILFGGQQLEISIPTSGQLRTGVTTNARYVSNHGSGLTNGNWHHIGFTFNGTTKTSYINGQAVGTQNTAGTLTSTFTNRTIGRWGSSTQYYMNGYIGSVQIHNRALTPEEVLTTYNLQRSRFQ